MFDSQTRKKVILAKNVKFNYAIVSKHFFSRKTKVMHSWERFSYGEIHQARNPAALVFGCKFTMKNSARRENCNKKARWLSALNNISYVQCIKSKIIQFQIKLGSYTIILWIPKIFANFCKTDFIEIFCPLLFDIWYNKLVPA